MVLLIATLSVLLSRNQKANENGESLIISVPTITPYPGNQLGKISVIPDEEIPTAPPTPIPREGDIILVEPWELEQDEKGDIIFKYTKSQVQLIQRRGMLKSLEEFSGF